MMTPPNRPMTKERWRKLFRKFATGCESDVGALELAYEVERQRFEIERLQAVVGELVLAGSMEVAKNKDLRAENERLRDALVRVDDQLGEAVHAGFRKGTDAHGAMDIWRAIAKFDGWTDVVNFALDGMGVRDALNPDKGSDLE